MTEQSRTNESKSITDAKLLIIQIPFLLIHWTAYISKSACGALANLEKVNFITEQSRTNENKSADTKKNVKIPIRSC